jgi:hypothetical protein
VAEVKGPVFEVELMHLSDKATYVRFNQIKKEESSHELDVPRVSMDENA